MAKQVTTELCCIFNEDDHFSICVDGEEIKKIPKRQGNKTIYLEGVKLYIADINDEAIYISAEGCDSSIVNDFWEEATGLLPEFQGAWSVVKITHNEGRKPVERLLLGRMYDTDNHFYPGEYPLIICAGWINFNNR